MPEFQGENLAMTFENPTATRYAPDAQFSIEQLRAAVTGRVITSDDADYDKARTVFYGGIDRHPAAIVRVKNAQDVSQVINFAQENNVELAVRGGGHSVAGHSAIEGGVVLDLSEMKGLEIDVKKRTAWAEAGLTAGEYTKAAGAHGLATGFGDTGTVGIGGITLGGGVGFFVRKYGLTIDDLLAAEIVTADGQILQVDADNHPDLFWAIRGGGGNFGVVTRFQYRLHEVGQVIGGMMILPATPDNLRALVAESEAAPEDLSIIAAAMVAPPVPFLPQEVHGQLVLMVMLVYAGDLAEGEKVVGKLKAIATPLADMVRPMAYHEMYEEEDAGDYHPMAASHTMFLDTFDQRHIDLTFDHIKQSTAMMSVMQIRPMGGAMARVPADATAFAHRNRRYMVNVAALYGDPAEAATHTAWVNKFAAALQDGQTVGAYVNFLGDEGAKRVRDAYPGATWERLTAIKRRYDPTNLFHMNQNITPAE